MPDAVDEATYVFRHALLREAVYELQLPGDRAALHRIAISVLHGLYGEPAPLQGPENAEPVIPISPLNALAADLASHAALALTGAGDEGDALQRLELDYLWRAAVYARLRRDQLSSTQLYRRIAEHPAVSPPRRTVAQYMYGTELLAMGAFRDSVAALESALRMVHLGGGQYEPRVLSALGLAHTNLGDLQTAETELRRAARLAREAGHVSTHTAATFNLARVLLYTGRAEEAERSNLECLELERAAGNTLGMGSTLCNIGNLLWQTGRYAEAEKRFHESLACLRQVDHKRDQGNALIGLGGLLAGQGRPEEGFAFYEEALILARQIPDAGLEAAVMSNMAGSLGPQGDWSRMRTLAERAIEIHRELGVRRFECYTLTVLSMANRELGDLDAAWQAGLQSLAMALDMKDRRMEANARVELAGVCHARGESEAGLAHVDAAVAEFRSAGDALALNPALELRATLLASSGK